MRERRCAARGVGSRAARTGDGHRRGAGADGIHRHREDGPGTRRVWPTGLA
jgi:hypothetical protein